jgi:hypothetical protein
LTPTGTRGRNATPYDLLTLPAHRHPMRWRKRRRAVSDSAPPLAIDVLVIRYGRYAHMCGCHYYSTLFMALQWAESNLFEVASGRLKPVDFRLPSL